MSNWYVRTLGLPSNGGSSVGLTPDRSGTDGVGNGTTTFTASSGNFTSADVGKGINVGGSTVYRIVAVTNGTTITLNNTRSTGTALAWAIGGALNAPNSLLLGSTNNVARGGDTIWIGGGTYTTILSSSSIGLNPASTVAIRADTDGVVTGDPGLVTIVGGSLNGPHGRTPITQLTLNNYLSFYGIVFRGLVLDATTTPVANVLFSDCWMIMTSSNALVNITGFATGVPLNITFDRCRFIRRVWSDQTASMLTITLPSRSASPDYDANVLFRNSLFVGYTQSYPAVNVVSSGALTYHGGGVRMVNCTGISNGGNGQIVSTAGGLSTSVQCSFYNCVTDSYTVGMSLQSGSSVEDYNYPGGALAGAHDRGDYQYPHDRLLSWGENDLFPGRPIPLGMPLSLSPVLGFGSATVSADVPTVDISGAPRPSGTITYGSDGTATAGGTRTLTDTAQQWVANAWVGWSVRIAAGTGSGQVKTVSSNTATVLTVDGNWLTQPDATSRYVVYSGTQASQGRATAGTTTTVTDANAAWAVNAWGGYTISIDSGTGAGQTGVVGSNTATVLTTVAAFTTAPDSTSTYSLYRGTGVTNVPIAAGCWERGNSFVRETTTVHSGSSGLMQMGPGYHDFNLSVNPIPQTFSVWLRRNGDYAGTTLPTMEILNGTECGVANASVAMTAAADTWQQVSLTFTPTKAGIVTMRLHSYDTGPIGKTYADDFAKAA